MAQYCFSDFPPFSGTILFLSALGTRFDLIQENSLSGALVSGKYIHPGRHCRVEVKNHNLLRLEAYVVCCICDSNFAIGIHFRVRIHQRDALEIILKPPDEFGVFFILGEFEIFGFHFVAAPTI